MDARLAIYRHIRWVVVALILPGTAPAQTASHGKAEMERTRIVKEEYHGWPNTYRLSNGLIEARVITDIGPRVMDFRAAGGDNLLQPRDGQGGTGEGTYMFRGGWRLWVAPERTATTYALDNTACAVQVIDDSTIRVTGAPQPAAGIQKQIELWLGPGESRLRITARIKNISDHPLTYAAWSLPVLRPHGRAFVPLDVGPPTAFDAVRRLILWSYARFDDPRYHFGNRLIEVDHARVQASLAGQTGRHDDESKFGVDSTQGWAAYLLDGTLFLKRFPHDATGQYPDGGATIEVYSNSELVELENLGPLTTIAPGREIVAAEDWWVFSGVTIPDGEAAASDAVQAYVARTAALSAGQPGL